jgi:hypothetical protein
MRIERNWNIWVNAKKKVKVWLRIKVRLIDEERQSMVVLM